MIKMHIEIHLFLDTINTVWYYDTVRYTYSTEYETVSYNYK